MISELRSNESEREQLEMEAKNVELRQALGLVEVRGHPLFQAAVARKTFPGAVRQAWSAWPWASGHLSVGQLLVFTDGSAVLSAVWPRAVCKAGWSAACF